MTSRGLRAWAFNDSLAAVATWLMGTTLAVLLVRTFDLDPFSVGGVVMPIGVGGVVAAVLVALLLRRRSTVLFGVAAGAYASWMALTLATALHGTPYGYGILRGDAGRFVAAATKYMHTSRSTDFFVAGIPSEYPPLYPWVVGHVARVVDRPAWQLFGEMQIVVMSLGVVVGYVLWRRLASPGVSFAIVALAPAVWADRADPSKDYEFIALMVFVPWVLATFALPRARGGMHWAVSGVIGGLMVSWYQAWLLLASIGLLAVIVLALRARADRRRYLLHLLGVAATAFAVGSWYLVPFLTGVLTSGGSRISDLWLASVISQQPLVIPFTVATPVGVVQLAGLLGAVWYRRAQWWAEPLLVLLLGTYAYRVVFLLRTAHDDHTGYLQYTEPVISMVLLVAGVLTLATAAPGLWRRVSAAPFAPGRERTVAVTAVTVAVLWGAMHAWESYVPGPRGLTNSSAPVGRANLGTAAHAEPLPDGTPTRFAPSDPKLIHKAFPTSRIEKVVRDQWHGGRDPVVLSHDQRLFGFVGYTGYTAVDRLAANTFQLWDERAAEISKVASVTEPAAFAEKSLHTRFGSIDVFVLKENGKRWSWNKINFSPTSFDGGFSVVKVGDGTVVAVRRT